LSVVSLEEKAVPSYQDLLAWQKAMELITEVYRETLGFPPEELYGLTSQMRRAAVSIASNIAEGQGRITKGEFIQFLGHARGSLLELETQVLVAKNLQYLDEPSLEILLGLTGEVGRLPNGLLSSIKRR
jgi:four helix bundle protein